MSPALMPPLPSSSLGENVRIGCGIQLARLRTGRAVRNAAISRAACGERGLAACYQPRIAISPAVHSHSRPTGNRTKFCFMSRMPRGEQPSSAHKKKGKETLHETVSDSDDRCSCLVRLSWLCPVLDHQSLPTSSSLEQRETNGGVAQAGFAWREEARELRTFADRHDVEAEVLLQRPLPSDSEMIRQRRALARQLRVAAAQIEQGLMESEVADGLPPFSNPL